LNNSRFFSHRTINYSINSHLPFLNNNEMESEAITGKMRYLQYKGERFNRVSLDVRIVGGKTSHEQWQAALLSNCDLGREVNSQRRQAKKCKLVYNRISCKQSIS